MIDAMTMSCILLLVVSAFAVLHGAMNEHPTPPDPSSDFPSRSSHSPLTS